MLLARAIAPRRLGAALSRSFSVATAGPSSAAIASPPPTPLRALAARWLAQASPALSALLPRAPDAAAARAAAPSGAMWPWQLAPALTAACSLLPELNFPSIVLVGKKKHHGKNKRYPKPANHGARPANHIGRHQRWKARGSYKARMKP